MKNRKLIVFATFLRYFYENIQALTSWNRCNRMIEDEILGKEAEEFYCFEARVIGKTFRMPTAKAQCLFNGVSRLEPNPSLALRVFSECADKMIEHGGGINPSTVEWHIVEWINRTVVAKNVIEEAEKITNTKG